MKIQLNRKAWEMLTPDEQTALNLQYGLTKSSWQSGEIMRKSHYKYLEIKYRAEHFLKMFTEHIDIYDCLIPDHVTGNKTVIHYFRECIEKRKKPMVVIAELLPKINKNQLNERIITTLENWENDENPFNQTIYTLVKEFDRWNNFRILPKGIQEPSAYKRRIKNSYKKQIRITSTINSLSLDKLIRLYSTTNSPYTYWPIIYKSEPKVFRVKTNLQMLRIFNELGFYLFDKREQARDYIDNISTYTSKGKKACTDGLDFWPTYRELIKKARNYQDIQKIVPSRRFLQMALQKLTHL